MMERLRLAFFITHCLLISIIIGVLWDSVTVVLADGENATYNPDTRIIACNRKVRANCASHLYNTDRSL